MIHYKQAYTTKGFVGILHKTAVFEKIYGTKNTTLIFNTGGWDTVSTRRAINLACSYLSLNYYVFRKKGITYLQTPAGEVIPFVGNKVKVRFSNENPIR